MNSVLLFAARGWSQLSALILMLVAGRFLAIGQFGEFTLAAAVALMLNQFMGVGTFEYVIRHGDERDAPTTAFWVNAALGCAYWVGGTVIAFVAGRIFRSDTVTTLVVLMVPLSIPAGARAVAESILVRDGRMGSMAVTSIVVETAALAVGVGGLMTGWGVFSLVASRYVQSGLSSLIFLAVARWLPAFHFSRVQASGMMRLWRSMIVDRGLGYLQNYGADLLLGGFMTPAAVAIYRIGARIVALVTTIVYEPMRTINWRILSHIQSNSGEVARATELIIGCVYLLLLGPLLLLGVMGGDLAVLALGPQWHGTGPVVLLLSISALFGLPAQLSEPAFGVAGAIRRLPIQRSIMISISLALLLSFARYGPSGAAASQATAASLGFLVTAVLQNRVIGVHPRHYLVNAACALGAGLASILVTELMGHVAISFPAAIRVVMVIAMGVGTYAALVLLFRRGPLLHLLRLASGPGDVHLTVGAA